MIRLAVRVAARARRAGARRAARARARRAGGARRRRRHGRVRALRRARRAARRSATLRAAAGGALVDVSTTEVADDSATGATGTGRSTSARCACGRRGSRAPGRARRRHRSRPGVRHRLAPDDAADARAAGRARRAAARSPTGAAAAAILAIAAAKLGCDAGARLRPSSRESVEAATLAARRRTASRSTVTRCDLRRAAGPWAPTVLANLVRPLLLEVAAPDGAAARAADRLRARGAARSTRSWRRSRATACARRRAATATAGPRSCWSRVITLDDVQAAARRLDGVAHRTPVLTSRALDEATGATRAPEGREPPARRRLQVPRRLQRGRLADATRSAPRGVATVSSGNHAQALALAARLHERAGGDPDARGRAGRQARRHRGLRRRGRSASTATAQDREALLAALVAERGLVPDPPVRRRARDGRPGHGRARADRGRRAARPAARLRRRRRADLRLRHGRRGAVAGHAGRSASSRRRATTSSARWRRASACGSTVPRTIADGQQLPMPGRAHVPGHPASASTRS